MTFILCKKKIKISFNFYQKFPCDIVDSIHFPKKVGLGAYDSSCTCIVFNSVKQIKQHLIDNDSEEFKVDSVG